MSILETDTIKQTRELITDTISSGIDALPLDEVADVTDTIAHAATVAAAKSGKGVFRTYRTVTRTVREHPKGAGATLLAVLALVGVFMWWSKRSASADADSLHVAPAAA